MRPPISQTINQPTRSGQPWLASARFDLLWIIGPAYAITALVVMFAGRIDGIEETPEWLWALLVMGVDVSHVYSTLYRTYFDRAEMQARAMLYLATPALLLAAGWMLYALGGATLFWRVLAYAAVFHFIRQQYGFFMLYCRRERAQPAWQKRLDLALIYLATLVPLIHWHTHDKTITWFIANDFPAWDAPAVSSFAEALYALLALAYVAKEFGRWRRDGTINIPKQLLLAGTALSWWVGIVSFDNDLAFTAINTVAHGIPYLALIWFYGRQQQACGEASWYWPQLGRLFSRRWLPAFIGLLLAIACIEEGLWDGWVWRQHATLFAPFQSMPAMPEAWLVFLVPLLTLPQATHYVLDAFIWRLKTPDTPWARILLYQPPSQV